MAGAPPAPKGPTPTEDALWFFGILAILIILWYFAGGPGQVDLRGLFLSPPAPLGNGEAYGPQLDHKAATDATTTQEQTTLPPPEQLPPPTY